MGSSNIADLGIGVVEQRVSEAGVKGIGYESDDVFLTKELDPQQNQVERTKTKSAVNKPPLAVAPPLIGGAGTGSNGADVVRPRRAMNMTNSAGRLSGSQLITPATEASLSEQYVFSGAVDDSDYLAYAGSSGGVFDASGPQIAEVFPKRMAHSGTVDDGALLAYAGSSGGVFDAGGPQIAGVSPRRMAHSGASYQMSQTPWGERGVRNDFDLTAQRIGKRGFTDPVVVEGRLSTETSALTSNPTEVADPIVVEGRLSTETAAIVAPSSASDFELEMPELPEWQDSRVAALPDVLQIPTEPSVAVAKSTIDTDLSDLTHLKEPDRISDFPGLGDLRVGGFSSQGCPLGVVGGGATAGVIKMDSHELGTTSSLWKDFADQLGDISLHFRQLEPKIGFARGLSLALNEHIEAIRDWNQAGQVVFEEIGTKLKQDADSYLEIEELSVRESKALHSDSTGSYPFSIRNEGEVVIHSDRMQMTID